MAVMVHKSSEEENKPSRYYSNKQEKRVAKTVQGRQTPNSGATNHKKGDVSTSLFTLECKTKMTNAQSISIKKEWLDKLKEEALFNHTPYKALIFNFGPDSEDYAIIDMPLFLAFQEFIKSLDEE